MNGSSFSSFHNIPLFSVGETTNLMAIDTQKLMDAVFFLNTLWACPLQIFLAMFFLWQILGPSAMAGLAVMLIMLPLNMIVGNFLKKLQQTQMKQKDKRVVLMDQILNGIKVIKLYAWEKVLKGRVDKLREAEMNALIKAAYLNSVTTLMWSAAPVLVALASFATFVLIDENNVLDASTAFVSLTLFNLLRLPLTFLPMLVMMLVQSTVTIKRLNKFMNSDELDKDAASHDEAMEDPIVIKNASFSWDRDAEPTLKNINLRVKKGSLVAIVGQVGSGKSSLISAILGEMHKSTGMNNKRGKIAYVPQQAWMQNNSLKDNILFGKPFDKSSYKSVLEGCSLTPDLQVLPAGDSTEIGERGINLSGGQRQRISMARATYSNGDVYLLDDPLSAVDSHVGKHIFENVIGPTGMLGKKTVVLVTHGISFLSKMDHIVVMRDGTISEQGSYEDLVQAGGEFAEFLETYAVENESIEEDYEAGDDLEGANDQDGKGEPATFYSRGVSDRMTSTNKEEVKIEVKSSQKGEKLKEEEKIAVGGVSSVVYLNYAKAVGLLTTITAFLLYAAFKGFGMGGSIWLSKWSTDQEAGKDSSVQNFYLGIYGMFGCLQAVFVMFATAFIQVGTLKASSALHQNMLEGIMHSTMAFFDTTPIGRILNRFSKDVDMLDIVIPNNLRMLFEQLMVVIGTMVIICYTNPTFIAAVVPISIM